MKVKVKFEYEDDGEEVFKNVEEIHYNYESPVKDYPLAIECKDTGYVYSLEHIEEFEVVPDDKEFGI